MRRISSHQTEAFDAIVRTHQGAVRTFLRRLTRNSALADELAQETFLTAFRKSETIDEIDNMRSWLLRLAYRQFLDVHRRDKRRQALSLGNIDNDEAPTSHHGTRLDIARAMDALPPERRACAMLCLALGHSHADAAQITGLPLGTVKSHVNRAKTALQTSLSAYQNEIAGDAP